jgi:uncharacterized protein (TIGR00255 family)
MIASMTAFCRAQLEQPQGHLVWEIRSVNHRYLDVHLKLPEELRSLEPSCRERVNKRLNRGRVDALLKFEAAPSTAKELVINSESLDAIVLAVEQVRARSLDCGQVSPIDMLRWPGVIEQTKNDIDSLTQAALDSFDNALSELTETRTREGARLGKLISDRIDAARKIVGALRDDLPEIELSMKQRWQRRLDDLGDEVDPARLNQELALLLTRSDVSEELDRLDTHFDEVSRVLGEKKPVGRRLDFLMQELNREANTLGSKSVDLRNTNASVELKVLIDQMREQVQNIE